MDIKRVFATFAITSTLFAGNNYYLQEELKDSEDEAKGLENRLELKDSEIDELEGSLEKYKGKIDKLNNSLDKKDNKIDKLDSKLNETLKENEKLESEIETIKKSKSKKRSETKKKKQSVNFNESKKGSDTSGRKLNVEMTAYIALCKEGCTGVTTTGIDIRDITTYQGHRIIATDPSVIPLYSIVRIDVDGQSFTAISLDTGGAINGNIIDFLVSSESEAINFGRKNATITVIREGK